MKITAAFVIGIGVGFCIGAKSYNKFVTTRLDAAIPILANVLSDLMEKMIEENLSVDEIRALANEELAFLKLALDN